MALRVREGRWSIVFNRQKGLGKKVREGRKEREEEDDDGRGEVWWWKKYNVFQQGQRDCQGGTQKGNH